MYLCGQPRIQGASRGMGRESPEVVRNSKEPTRLLPDWQYALSKCRAMEFISAELWRNSGEIAQHLILTVRIDS